MFGISPLGWLHTLGSLPAIPLAIYMFVRHGHIVPRSIPGKIYFGSMLIGALTVFLVAHQSISYGIGAATLAFLLVGYNAHNIFSKKLIAIYVERIFLTITTFLLMVPTLTETLRRVPDGHPIVTDLKSPLLLTCQKGLVVLLVFGLGLQIAHLRKKSKLQQI